MHDHKYAYGDVPGLGECKCGAYRVWDRQDSTYKEYEGECDKCSSAYDLSSRDNRCGDCGNCDTCCTHKGEEK